MFAYIEGNIAEKNTDSIVIEAGGIGWELRCSLQTIRSLPPPGASAKVYTRMRVSENAPPELFGFATREERTMFEKLCTVNGVGAKSAQSLLSALTVKELLAALSSSNVAQISKAQGIGRKTAERIIMDLRDKLLPLAEKYFGAQGQLPDMPQSETTPTALYGAQSDAASALASLGFPASEAKLLVARVIGVRMEGGEAIGSAEEIVRDALRMRNM
ncbi:MAG: Holliday junction branch migration protein RuvA [Oscillospiraceae bacterium]|jgi:Holliday junction DNA helicase RuvA|nr:Holliday junction branch migration protein RuvA [Oscillospiraceae bacterium]